MIVATAPARANLIGNPSDQYGGSTLSCSVPLRARVEVERAASLELCSGDGVCAIRSPDDLALRGDDFDVARAVLADLGGALPQVRVRIGSAIPRQSGMAGSTALVVALLRALLVLRDESPGPYGLAERARRIERDRLGIQCGFVDQYLCVFGGLRYVDLRGKARDDTPAPPFATVEDLGPWVPRLPFVLAFTGVRHLSDAVHRPLRERWLAGEPQVVEAYARIGELGRQGKRALIDQDFERFGRLMNENHAVQRGLGGSGPANERLIEAALAAGAEGAKLAGAGDGGTVVVLWTGSDPEPLEKALREAGAVELFRPEPVPGVELARLEQGAGVEPG